MSTKTREVFEHLVEEMRVLANKKEEHERILRENGEVRGGRPIAEVSLWLEQVNTLVDSVNCLQLPAESHCFAGCHTPASLLRQIAFRQNAAELTVKARRLLHTDVDLTVSPSTVKLTTPEAAIPTWMMKPLRKVLAAICDDDVGIVGVFCQAGMEMSDLLEMVHENVPHGAFDVVMSINVSGPGEKWLQRQILGFLGLSSMDDGEEWVCSTMLNRILAKKRFLLLLNKLEKPLNLAAIGLPLPDGTYRRKIVFTTRNVDMCRQMNAKWVVEMPFLSKEEAWLLFMKSFSNEDILLEPIVKLFASRIVEKCGGIPLAITVMAQAMSGVQSVRQWMRTMKEMSDFSRSRSEESLQAILKFCFDGLTEHKKKCLLYCSLFPSWQPIHLQALVDQVITDGKFRSTNTIADDRRKTLSTIFKLQKAFFLKRLKLSHQEVMMNPAVRRMLLRMKGDLYLVHAGEDLRAIPGEEEEKWKMACRISFIGNDIEKLPEEVPHCPQLETLLLSSNPRLASIPMGYFPCMPSLTRLDVSKTSISDLPREINLLKELRYLNASFTKLAALPVELGELVKLKQLNLEGTVELRNVPQRAISTLHHLMILNMYRSGFCWTDEAQVDGDGIGLVRLEDVEVLERLDEVGLNIKTTEAGKKLLGSTRLLSCITHLEVESGARLNDAVFDGASSAMSHLRKLRLLGSYELTRFSALGRLEELRSLILRDLPRVQFTRIPHGTHHGSFKCVHLCLRYVWIESCKLVKDLRGVAQLPRLTYLRVWGCEELEELVESCSEVEEEQPFLSLRVMDLRGLPKLRVISSGGGGEKLKFPSLEGLVVRECPSLKVLPLGFDSARGIKEIIGETAWWDGLHWEDAHVKAFFSLHFADPWFFGDEDDTIKNDSRYAGWDEEY